MNKILVEVSVGELLDKLSILEIKKEKILLIILDFLFIKILRRGIFMLIK